jgi:predicted DsbA family dithiol-disulfide isomerase
VAALRITEYTDPGCPWAFSAEPSRLRLRWLYGGQLEWTRRMVVLSESPADYEEKGFTPEKMSASFKKIRADHGMPIAAHERPRMHATAPACRAVVAARLHVSPAAEMALLRRLRVLCMAGALLDEDATIERAACDVGVDPDELRGWMAGADVEAELRSDMAAARDPSDAALVLDWKLADSEDGMRYTCPSYQFINEAGECFDIPGFRPGEAYEVAIANLAPELDRRHDPSSVDEVLDWASGEPLATIEVARVAQLDPSDARESLAATGATFTPVGNDGYWSP